MSLTRDIDLLLLPASAHENMEPPAFANFAVAVSEG
jgi:hypothetical protein